MKQISFVILVLVFLLVSSHIMGLKSQYEDKPVYVSKCLTSNKLIQTLEEETSYPICLWIYPLYLDHLFTPCILVNQEAEAAAAAEVAFVIQGVQRRGLEFAIPVGLAPPLGPRMNPLQEPVQ